MRGNEIMNKKIGIIGSGIVGQTLANGFIKHGYPVMIGTNTANKYAELKEKTNGKANIGSFSDTARFGDIVVIAAKVYGTRSGSSKKGHVRQPTCS